MLVISALLSIVFVTFVYFSHKKQGGYPVLMSFFFAVTSVPLGVCLMPSLFLHAALVFIGALVWKNGGWGSSSFLAYMGISAIGPYGLIAYHDIEQMSEHQRLLDQNAFESMENRVPAPKIADRTKPSNEMESQLTSLEQKLKGDFGENSFRTLMLQRLHGDSVRSFIDSPGLGQGRRIRPTEQTLKVNLQSDERPLAQPGAPPLSTITENELVSEPSAIQPDPLREMHLTSVLDFVNAEGFGWLVNRQKVAGFRPHHFRMTPQAKQWKVQTVELVGILMHDQPVIYMSNELPSMDKLRKVPTRSLNAFESAGLQKLQEGDDLFIREASEGVRMLGAVRSIEQCVKCHGGERGDLLGAFSYSLVRAAKDAER